MKTKIIYRDIDYIVKNAFVVDLRKNVIDVPAWARLFNYKKTGELRKINREVTKNV